MTDMAIELVTTALDYPFPREDHSFLFVDGERLAMDDYSADGLDKVLAQFGAVAMAERTAVLAYGANAAPIRLKRKFASQLSGVIFPVIEARLHNFDIVYASHFSSYGALPATPIPSLGTAVDVAVTYLDRDQLLRMHETELLHQSYVFGRLGGIRLVLDTIGLLDSVHSYWSRHGSFTSGCGPLALKAIDAEGRRFKAVTQDAVQRLARDYLAPGCDLNKFIAETASELVICRKRSMALSQVARPFDYSQCEILAM